MKNNVRITSDQNVITDAVVELRVEREDGTEEWVDVRNYVTRIAWDVSVGDASMVTLGLMPAKMCIEGTVDRATQHAFAQILKQYGWTMEAPALMDNAPLDLAAERAKRRKLRSRSPLRAS